MQCIVGVRLIQFAFIVTVPGKIDGDAEADKKETQLHSSNVALHNGIVCISMAFERSYLKRQKIALFCH